MPPVTPGRMPPPRTRPTTTRWLPAVFTHEVRHSIQAEAASRIAAPVRSPGTWGTEESWLIAGRPGLASQSAAGRPSGPRMLSAHGASLSTASARRASSCTVNSTVGGCSETETREVAVIARSRLRYFAATTLTPETRRLMIPRKSSSSISGITPSYLRPLRSGGAACAATDQCACEECDEDAHEPAQSEDIFDDDDVATGAHRGDEEDRPHETGGVGERRLRRPVVRFITAPASTATSPITS